MSISSACLNALLVSLTSEMPKYSTLGVVCAKAVVILMVANKSVPTIFVVDNLKFFIYSL